MGAAAEADAVDEWVVVRLSYQVSARTGACLAGSARYLLGTGLLMPIAVWACRVEAGRGHMAPMRPRLTLDPLSMFTVRVRTANGAWRLTLDAWRCSALARHASDVRAGEDVGNAVAVCDYSTTSA